MQVAAFRAAVLCYLISHLMCVCGCCGGLSRVYLPVFVEGANLSMGDMHFSQGDGEVRSTRSLQCLPLVNSTAVCNILEAMC